MRSPSILLAAALLLPAAGCIVYEREPGPPVAGPPVVEEHHYVYFPAYGAYYCTVHDDWWILDGPTWVLVPERPAFITLSAEVAWVDVDDRGPEPFRHYEDHRRRFPAAWRPERSMGPPPGRAGHR